MRNVLIGIFAAATSLGIGASSSSAARANDQLLECQTDGGTHALWVTRAADGVPNHVYVVVDTDDEERDGEIRVQGDRVDVTFERGRILGVKHENPDVTAVVDFDRFTGLEMACIYTPGA